MSQTSHRPNHGPANKFPPLRCERLEDRSLLSTSGVPSPVEFCLEDRVEIVESPDGSVVLDGEDATLTIWIGEESEVGYDDTWYDEEVNLDEEYYDDTWMYEEEYYDDSWYEEEYYDDSWYTDEEYYDETWVYEEEYYDDSWYTDEEYYDDTWYTDEEYYDETWVYEEEYYDDTWYTDEELVDVICQPVGEPGEYEIPLRDGTQWDIDGLPVQDDGMIYAMDVAGGIPVSETPLVEAVAEAVTLPSPAEEPVNLLPPESSEAEVNVPAEVAAPDPGTDPVTPPATPVEETESDSAALGFASTGESEGHLAADESLELSEDLPVG